MGRRRCRRTPYDPEQPIAVPRRRRAAHRNLLHLKTAAQRRSIEPAADAARVCEAAAIDAEAQYAVSTMTPCFVPVAAPSLLLPADARSIGACKRSQAG